MKKYLFICFIFLFFSCEQDDLINEEDEKVANELWTEINGYPAWNQSIEWSGIKQSLDGTHGNFVQIWFNNLADSSFRDSTTSELSEGSIIVKEGYATSDGSGSKTITLMKKTHDYNPNHGDWFWASYSESGSINSAGRLNNCISCHISGVDYVRFNN